MQIWDIFSKYSKTMNACFSIKGVKPWNVKQYASFYTIFFLKPSSSTTVEKWKCFFVQNFFLYSQLKKLLVFFSSKVKKKQRKGENWLYWLLTCFSDGYYTVDLDVHPIAIFGAKHFELWTVWENTAVFYGLM